MVSLIDEDYLLNTESYIEFISYFFNKKQSRLSYQAFANKAGYSTKSYVAEILSGKKYLNLISVEKFSKGLGLNKALTEYLKNLVLLDLVLRKKITNLSEQNIKLKLNEIRINKIKKNNIRLNKTESNQNTLMLQENFPEIFASLGTTQTGSTIEEILTRTTLAKDKVIKILAEMEKTNFVLKKDLVYYPLTNLLDFEFINSNYFFKENFSKSAHRALKRFNKPNQSEKSLYLTQTFSIKIEDFSRLKNELKEFLIQFCNNAEKADGNAIAEICVSFTTNK